MPIYEYECNSCKEIMEVSQSLSDTPKTICPTCSGPLKKLISMSSFQLKGSGWYSDGYSGTSNCEAKCKAESSTTSAAPASTTNETTPTTPTKPSAEKSCPKAAGAACPCA